MRKRFKRNAICSSENYKASRNSHLAYLQEQHESFSVSMMSHAKHGDNAKDELSLDRKLARLNDYVYIKVFGRFLKLTVAEYNERCQGMPKYYKPED